MNSITGTVKSRVIGRGKYWAVTTLAIIALLLSIVSVVLVQVNNNDLRKIQINQQYINQSVKLGQINSQLIQELANVSARTNDEQIRELLLSHGITFRAK